MDAVFFERAVTEPPQPRDYALVMRALDGEPRAFELLYHRHAPTIGRRLRHMVHQKEDADDLLQATFYEAHRSLARFRADASFESWLHAIAFRLVGNHIKARRRKWWQVLAPEPVDTVLAGSDLENQVDSRQQVARLYALLDSLPPDKRIAFCLYEFEGLELAEIGKLMGTSAQTIWARVESARKALVLRLKVQAGEQTP